MGVAQKPRSWPRWVNFTPALVGHFYIGGDNYLFESLNELQEFATNWLWVYNHERPNMALGGYTPKQRLAQAA